MRRTKNSYLHILELRLLVEEAEDYLETLPITTVPSIAGERWKQLR